MTRIISVLFYFLILAPTNGYSKDETPYFLSYSSGAYAPNAGGQDVHVVRLMKNSREFHLYLNRSLTVGSQPLFGGGYDIRFDLCEDCFWKFFVQTGVGSSLAGVYGEFLWGAQIPILPIWLPMDPPRYVPFLRIDFATHLIFGHLRPNTWSYPIWIGVGIPL
ncbi:MAG: hypothetical protein NT027_15265 [Proteobacteria bacterium]|nr:hypothetical protein [Pseudomonadota bacterium]